MWQLSLSCGENLTTNVFKNNRPWFKVHHQHGLQLSLCPLQLHLSTQGKYIKRMWIFIPLNDDDKACGDHYLSCTAAHLDELSGDYFHHFSHLEINKWNKKKNHKKHETIHWRWTFPKYTLSSLQGQKSESTLPIYPLFTGLLPLLEFSFRFDCLFLSLWPLPPFLSKLLSIHPQVRALRLSNQRILDAPRTRSKTEGIGPFQL